MFLTWNHPDEKGVYTGKLFDYLAAQRLVLAMGIPGSVIEELLDKTQSCLYVSSIEELKSAILSYYQEYKLTGKVAYKGNPVEIENTVIERWRESLQRGWIVYYLTNFVFLNAYPTHPMGKFIISCIFLLNLTVLHALEIIFLYFSLIIFQIYFSTVF